MKVKLVQRPNPLEKDYPKKYYALAENEGVVDIYELAAQVAKYSSLSPGDVVNVFENMVDAASLYLLTGRGVRLGRLGMLRIVLKSVGVEAPEDFNCKLIRRIKLKFTPNAHMKKQLRDISYEMSK